MQEEIKEIIGLNCEEEIEVKYFAKDDSLAYKTMDYSELLDYITNLQEENIKLKELCDKYEEEHSITFQIWKYNRDTYKEENERLKKENSNLLNTNYWLNSRIDNANEFVKKESKKCYSNQTTDDPQKVIGNFMWHTDKLLDILQGVDKE